MVPAAAAASTANEDDAEEQADELEALTSIYPEKIVVVDQGHGSARICFEISVAMAPAVDSVPLFYVPGASERDTKKQMRRLCRFFGTKQGCRHGDRCKFLHQDASSGTSGAATAVAKEHKNAVDTGIRLRHLLPIVLRVTFPPNYPSKVPPDFTLSSPWLHQVHRERLRQSMLSEWDEGVPVVFTWIQNLESKEAVALINRIVLKQNAGANDCTGDGADGIDVDRLIDAMMHYDRQIQADEFIKSDHTCDICFDTRPGPDFIRFDASCGHFFCRECLTSYVDVHLRGSSPISDLCCPSGMGRCSERESKRTLTAMEVFRISGEEAKIKFERLQLQQALSSMGDIVFCPKQKGQRPTIEESEHFGHCPKCRFAFCTLCFESFHPGSECITNEEAIRLARKHNSGGTNGHFGPEEQERRKRLIQQAQSLALIRKSTKQCPSCRSAVSKTRGCNKMTCPCGTKFCYSCSKNITTEGYDHFGPDSCVLFDDEAIRQWEAEMAGAQYNPEFYFGLQVRRAGGGDHGRERGGGRHRHQELIWLHCPRCRQRNVRGENGANQIRCWACRTKFCAACRSVITDSASHYGRGKSCRQHGGPIAVR